MYSTYNPEDVTILLKDITGLVTPLDTKERERFIQSGVHYSEMLPLEYIPSEKYLNLFFDALNRYSKMTAEAVAEVSRQIKDDKGKKVVLVSLARAGTPIGILIKHYLEQFCGVKAYHYTISIIRDKGIDKNAIDFIRSKHSDSQIQFVDGWTGKGAIQNELRHAMKEYPSINSGLAVLSDPADVADKAGTKDDFLIASSCLNSTVSGLLSRTFYRKDIIGPNDFHGAAFYKELQKDDLTYTFLDAVGKEFTPDLCYHVEKKLNNSGLEEVKQICREFQIADINLVKPSIGEATRVLLRRLPWKILVHSLNDNEHLGHLYQLAEEKGVELVEYPLKNYRACGLIKSLADN